jgi:hypothetical protein
VPAFFPCTASKGLHAESHLLDGPHFVQFYESSMPPGPYMRRTSKLAFASLLLAGSLPLAANAQSSGGNIAGEASVGDTVTITGVDTGFRRELKIEKDGKYQVRRVPTGDYMVVRVHKDGSIDPAQSVSVRVGSTARVMELPAKAGAPAAAGGQ